MKNIKVKKNNIYKIELELHSDSTEWSHIKCPKKGYAMQKGIVNNQRLRYWDTA